MKKASAWFSAEDHARITRAVRRAEEQTSAEIVPVVATASGRYDRAEDIAGLWLGAILLTLLWVWLPWQRTEEGSWDLSWQQLQLPILLAVLVGGFVLGAIVASKLPALRRLFTPRSEMREDTATRARQLFFDQRVHHTAGATGILFYLSLYERTAAVIADAVVTEKLGQPALDQLCADLRTAMRAGSPTEALENVIQDAGERLARVLPRESGDQNELEDALVLLD